MLKDPAGDQEAAGPDGIYLLEPIPRQVLSIGVHLSIVAVGVPVNRPFMVAPALPMPDGRGQADHVEVQGDQIEWIPDGGVIRIHREPEIKTLMQKLPDDLMLVVLIRFGRRESHVELIAPVMEE